jgi:hypothetical protein
LSLIYNIRYHAASNTFTIIAGSGVPGVPPPANQQIQFTVAGAPTATVTVVGESRTVSFPLVRFRFRFAFGFEFGFGFSFGLVISF